MNDLTAEEQHLIKTALLAHIERVCMAENACRASSVPFFASAFTELADKYRTVFNKIDQGIHESAKIGGIVRR